MNESGIQYCLCIQGKSSLLQGALKKTIHTLQVTVHVKAPSKTQHINIKHVCTCLISTIW